MGFDPVSDRRNFKKLIPHEAECVQQLKKEGILLDLELSSLANPNWRAFIRMRASNEDEVSNHLKSAFTRKPEIKKYF